MSSELAGSAITGGRVGVYLSRLKPAIAQLFLWRWGSHLWPVPRFGGDWTPGPAEDLSRPGLGIEGHRGRRGRSWV